MSTIRITHNPPLPTIRVRPSPILRARVEYSCVILNERTLSNGNVDFNDLQSR